jgi:hypothetical protein
MQAENPKADPVFLEVHALLQRGLESLRRSDLAFRMALAPRDAEGKPVLPSK